MHRKGFWTRYRTRYRNFAIPARTHPTYPHVRSKTANGENDVDRSERSKQDEVEEDDVAEDEVDDDDVEDDEVG